MELTAPKFSSNAQCFSHIMKRLLRSARASQRGEKCALRLFPCLCQMFKGLRSRPLLVHDKAFSSLRSDYMRHKSCWIKRNREILRERNEKEGAKRMKTRMQQQKGREREREREESRAKQARGRKRGEERGEKRRRREANSNECHIGTLWSCIIQIVLPEEAPTLQPIINDTHLKSAMSSSLLPELWNKSNTFLSFPLNSTDIKWNIQCYINYHLNLHKK